MSLGPGLSPGASDGDLDAGYVYCGLLLHWGSRVDGVFGQPRCRRCFTTCVRLISIPLAACGCAGSGRRSRDFCEYRACVCETLAPAPKRHPVRHGDSAGGEYDPTRPGSCWGLGHRASAHSCTLSWSLRTAPISARLGWRSCIQPDPAKACCLTRNEETYSRLRVKRKQVTQLNSC